MAFIRATGRLYRVDIRLIRAVDGHGQLVVMQKSAPQKTNYLNTSALNAKMNALKLSFVAER